MVTINRATNWEQGRTILKIGGLLIRHGYRDNPTWAMVDYYWRGKLVMTSARWYVFLKGSRDYLFIWNYGGVKFELAIDGVRVWRLHGNR